MDDQWMRGRVALVAGASKGIGATTAEAFAAAGASVVLGARTIAALESVVERIRGGGGEAIAVRTDVSDVDSMRDLVDRAVAAYGRLDAAFNNATDGPPPAPPVGQWAFDGHHNVVATFTAFEVGPNGPLGTVTVHIKARVRGDAMTGTYTATGVAPNGGALFPPDNGSFSGTRVTAEG